MIERTGYVERIGYWERHVLKDPGWRHRPARLGLVIVHSRDPLRVELWRRMSDRSFSVDIKDIEVLAEVASHLEGEDFMIRWMHEHPFEAEAALEALAL